MIKPLTLKLLKESNKYVPEKFQELLENDDQAFTPEQMLTWGFDAPDIVEVVSVWLLANDKEYENRLFMAEIIEPCSAIYAQYKLNKPNVVQNVIVLLKEKVLDRLELNAAKDAAKDAAGDVIFKDAAWAAAWATARDAAWAAAWAAARDAAWAAAGDAAGDFQIKLSIKFFNANLSLEIKQADSKIESNITENILQSIDNKLSEIIKLLNNK